MVCSDLAWVFACYLEEERGGSGGAEGVGFFWLPVSLPFFYILICSWLPFLCYLFSFVFTILLGFFFRPHPLPSCVLLGFASLCYPTTSTSSLGLLSLPLASVVLLLHPALLPVPQFPKFPIRLHFSRFCQALGSLVRVYLPMRGVCRRFRQVLLPVWCFFGLVASVLSLPFRSGFVCRFLASYERSRLVRQRLLYASLPHVSLVPRVYILLARYQLGSVF